MLIYFVGKILWDIAQWESVVCAAHRLQNATKHAVEKQSMQRLLAKCRHLVGHFKHSALATDSFDEEAENTWLYKNASCCSRSTDQVEQHFLYATEACIVKAAHTFISGGYHD